MLQTGPGDGFPATKTTTNHFISNSSKRKETLDKGYGFYSGYSVGRDWVNREIIA